MFGGLIDKHQLDFLGFQFSFSLTMNLSFRQLRVFLEVAHQGSVSRAAEVLHLTPPAVSMQIKEVENQVGLPLFDRVGRTLSLSTAGEYFVVHAKRMLGALRDAENAMSRFKRLEHGLLTVVRQQPALHERMLKLASQTDPQSPFVALCAHDAHGLPGYRSEFETLAMYLSGPKLDPDPVVAAKRCAEMSPAKITASAGMCSPVASRTAATPARPASIADTCDPQRMSAPSRRASPAIAVTSAVIPPTGAHTPPCSTWAMRLRVAGASNGLLP